MNDSPLFYRSACELGRLIGRGEVSSERVVRAHLGRLCELNPKLNAIIQIAPESAVEQARLADAAVAAGAELGLLHGVPFTVKDVYPVKNAAELVAVPGMPPLLDLPRDRDATAILRLRAAGAILIGVSRATVWKDREDRYGSVRNPYHLDMDAGGSSGGEAATIAAGGSPLGLGSDSGGSLRTPAGRCGIATIRPSNGRVPQAADGGRTGDPRTVAGPLARSVEDLAAALGIISGVDPLDPTTLPVPLGDWRTVRLAGLRVGVFAGSEVEPPSPLATAAVRDAAAALKEAGAHLAEAQPPDLAESWSITQEYWTGYPDGQNASRTFYGFMKRWDIYRVALALFMEDFDVLVCPVDPLIYTCVFSLVGWPCAVVRCGTQTNGLPIGVQVVSKPWRDDVALAAAAEIERTATAGGWRPPLM